MANSRKEGVTEVVACNFSLNPIPASLTFIQMCVQSPLTSEEGAPKDTGGRQNWKDKKCGQRFKFQFIARETV